MGDLREQLTKKHGVPVERVVIGKAELSRLVGIETKQLGQWAAATPPMPALDRGSEKPRVQWVYDIKAIIDWRIDRAYRAGLVDGASKAGGVGGPPEAVIDPDTGEEIEIDEDDISKEEVERQKAIYEMRLKRYEYDVKKGNVVYIDQVEVHLGGILANISENLKSLSSKMVARLVRVGWVREEATREIQDPIFAMIEETKNIDFTKDPSEVDAASADETEAKELSDGEAGEAGTD
jgi:hypothetical protein